MSEPYPQVLHIELARGPVNAFNTEYWRAYGKTFEDLTTDGYDVRVAVVSSMFAKTFTAGLDRACIVSTPNVILTFVLSVHDASDLGSNGTSDGGLDTARTVFARRKMLGAFQRAISSPERAPFPVIVALHGHVIGLGVDLIGACDIRCAAENALFSIKVCTLTDVYRSGSLWFRKSTLVSHLASVLWRSYPK